MVARISARAVGAGRVGVDIRRPKAPCQGSDFLECMYGGRAPWLEGARGIFSCGLFSVACDRKAAMGLARQRAKIHVRSPCSSLVFPMK